MAVEKSREKTELRGDEGIADIAQAFSSAAKRQIIASYTSMYRDSSGMFYGCSIGNLRTQC